MKKFLKSMLGYRVNFLVIVLFCAVATHAQKGPPPLSIIGDAAANQGEVKSYSIFSGTTTIYAANWSASGGVVLSQTNTTASIQWTTAGTGIITYNVTSSSSGAMMANKFVTVSASQAPNAPPSPSINFQDCTTAILEKSGSIPSGQMWYWQGTNANGTSTDFPATSNYTVTSSGNYKIRAKNTTTNVWSTLSSSISVTLGTTGGQIWYYDADGDGLGDPNVSLTQCSQPSNYVSNANDACPSSNGLGSGNGCPGGPVLSDENYIYTVIPQKEITNMNQITQNIDALKSVTYFDGLGRPMQNVAIKQSPQEKDIVQHIGYDVYGRQTKEYLPFASTENRGLYDTSAESKTKTYYKSAYADDFINITTANTNPYSEKIFEASPLNRPVEQTAPGKDWDKGAQNIPGKDYSDGKTIKYEYGANIASEVKIYTVTLSGTTPSLQGGISYYPAGKLRKSITKDANWTVAMVKNHTVEEFKNLDGNVVLIRRYNNGVKHDTYYVYDNYGNLTYVLPPKADANTNKPTTTELNELCYQYKYDAKRNRLVEKKLPSKGWEYLVYDKLDRPVLSQNANQKSTKKWLYTKYDKLGRVAYTGIYTHSTILTQVAMQNYFDTTNNVASELYESKQTTAGAQNIYYTNNNFPTNIEILTVNYYDNYSFNRAGSPLPTGITHAYGETLTTRTRGLETGSKVRVLGESTWITTVNYYDKRARAIYTYSKNDFLGTTDIVQSDVDFTGKVLETTSMHTNANDALPTQSIVDEFDYDHAGRVLEQKQFLNNNSIGQVIAKNVYDELGQVVTKEVGGKTNAITRLQKVDYKYNVRGWLRSINDIGNNNASIALANGDLFGFKMNYNTASDASKNLYNGNIAQTLWKSASANDTSNPVSTMYTYTYDHLNRLTNATDDTGNYNVSGITYDKNGNIVTLKREGKTNAGATSFGAMDDLVYQYYTNSNRLKKVTDSSTNVFGFKDGDNRTTEYTYDANGNMLRDYNKGITNNILYNHLQLPTKVTMTSTKYVEYTYDAVGTRLQKKVTDGSSVTITKYANGYNYLKTGTAPEVLQFINHAEGYIQNNSGILSYVYQYRDHLGNVRLTYADSNNNGEVTTSEIIDEKAYYPFGLTQEGYNTIILPNGNPLAQKYGYNGKEFNDDLDINWHDFGARNYDAALGRWMNIDPLAEKMTRHSPYNYAFNNPVYYIDPDGRAPSPMGLNLDLHSASWSSSNPSDWEYSRSKTNNGFGIVYKTDWNATGLNITEINRRKGNDIGYHTLYGMKVSDGKKSMHGYIASRVTDRGYRDDFYIDAKAVHGFIKNRSNYSAYASFMSMGGDQQGSVWNAYKSTWTIDNVLVGVSLGLGGFASIARSSSSKPLYHYTSKKNFESILDSKILNPSIGRKTARFGNGQYFTDIEPGTFTVGQLSYRLYGVPGKKTSLSHFIKIETSGLNIIKNKQYNYFNPSSSSLNLNGRIIGGGKTPFK